MSRRCHRLKKQCFSHERPSRKRTRISKPKYVPSAPFPFLRTTDFLFSRVAQLEQKLDGLVTLLTSNTSTVKTTPLDLTSNLVLPRSPMSLDSNASAAGPSTGTPQSINLDGETTAVRTFGGSIASADIAFAPTAGNLSFSNQGVPPVEPHGQEAEMLLLEFRTNMTEQFPFVVVHPDRTAQSLHCERPLLWKAIMVAALHRNSDRQMAVGAKLMENLTTRLLFKAEKSLDILQALLIFIAWYGFN